MIGLTVNCKPQNLLKDNIEDNLGDLGYGGGFLIIKTKGIIHERNDKWEFIKIKKLLCERHCQGNEKICKTGRKYL